MGRGNSSVSGTFEGVFYVNYDNLIVFRRDDDDGDDFETRLQKDVPVEEMDRQWFYDDEGSMVEQDWFEDQFKQYIQQRFPSFEPCDGAYGAPNAIMENGLFFITTEDNEWSRAVKLIQRDEDNIAGLQSKHYQRYLDGIRDALLDQFESIGIYAGPWTHGILRREEVTA